LIYTSDLEFINVKLHLSIVVSLLGIVMITFAGLIRTFLATRVLFNILPMKLSRKRMPITFRNGLTYQLTWPEFRMLRDNYSLMQKYAIKQVEDNLFEIQDGELKLIGSLHALLEFEAMENGMYYCDCDGKVVLDVGGYQGESAVFFSKMGAKKVIIYEPVIAHHRLIKKNVSLNHVNAEIHGEGIGNRDGTQIISYDVTNLVFGPLSKGQHTMEIKVRNVAEVIEKSGANVAKIDCEGAEKSLIDVPREILRRIELYIIEVHTPEIRRAIIEKFRVSDFSLEKEMVLNASVSVMFFRQDFAAKLAEDSLETGLLPELALIEY
jgi:FkbM family methyltransferase